MLQDLSIVAIIPLYNGADYIEEAIRSVLDQTRPPDEFIVVDDGSTDSGPEIVRSLARNNPQIRLLSKPNGGQSSARNFGVANSSSALIALLDQDDAWYPDHLAELVAVFRDYRDSTPLGWVYSDLDRVDEGGEMMVRSLLKTDGGEHPKRTLLGCLARDMLILPSASLIDRTAFLSVGGFDESLAGYEDDDLFLRLFRKGYQNLFVDKALSKWRYRTSSTSFSPRMEKSRGLYTDKLMRTYPDDRVGGLYYVRDYIAPRFAMNLFRRYLIALQADDRKTMRHARQEIGRLLPHLRTPHSLIFRCLRVGMAAPPLAKLGWSAWLLARPFTRRIRALAVAGAHAPRAV